MKHVFYWLFIVPIVTLLASTWFVMGFLMALLISWYYEHPFEDAWEFSTEMFSILREARP